jgi:hypothetical protein
VCDQQLAETPGGIIPSLQVPNRCKLKPDLA